MVGGGGWNVAMLFLFNSIKFPLNTLPLYPKLPGIPLEEFSRSKNSSIKFRNKVNKHSIMRLRALCAGGIQPLTHMTRSCATSKDRV